MPHDACGNELNPGDEVIVRCRVTQITSNGSDYCNVALETVEPMFPGEYKTSISLNAKQTERVPATPNG